MVLCSYASVSSSLLASISALIFFFCLHCTTPHSLYCSCSVIKYRYGEIMKQRSQTILLTFNKLLPKLKLWDKRNIMYLRALRSEKFHISCHIKHWQCLYIQPQICSCCCLWELLSSEKGTSFLTVHSASMWEKSENSRRNIKCIVYCIYCGGFTFTMCNKSGMVLKLLSNLCLE